jgi:hypothetical protein
MNMMMVLGLGNQPRGKSSSSSNRLVDFAVFGAAAATAGTGAFAAGLGASVRSSQSGQTKRVVVIVKETALDCRQQK